MDINNSRITTIYAIVEDSSNKKLYIGKTMHFLLEARLEEHWNEQFKKGRKEDNLKLLVLKAYGLKNLSIRPLRTVNSSSSSEDAINAEIEEINKCIDKGERLANVDNNPVWNRIIISEIKPFRPLKEKVLEVDAPERSHFSLTITAIDILMGERCNTKSCVIAEAIKRADPDVQAIEVGISITKITMAGVVVRYANNPRVSKAISIFDKTGKWTLPPGTYEFHAPKGTQRLGSRPSRWDKEPKTKTKPGQDKFNGKALPTRKITRAA